MVAGAATRRLAVGREAPARCGGRRAAPGLRGGDVGGRGGGKAASGCGGGGTSAAAAAARLRLAVRGRDVGGCGGGKAARACCPGGCCPLWRPPRCALPLEQGRFAAAAAARLRLAVGGTDSLCFGCRNLSWLRERLLSAEGERPWDDNCDLSCGGGVRRLRRGGLMSLCRVQEGEEGTVFQCERTTRRPNPRKKKHATVRVGSPRSFDNSLLQLTQ